MPDLLPIYLTFQSTLYPDFHTFQENPLRQSQPACASEITSDMYTFPSQKCRPNLRKYTVSPPRRTDYYSSRTTKQPYLASPLAQLFTPTTYYNARITAGISPLILPIGINHSAASRIDSPIFINSPNQSRIPQSLNHSISLSGSRLSHLRKLQEHHQSPSLFN